MTIRDPVAEFGLNDQERMFADMIFEGEPAKDAYHLAGYKGKHRSQWTRLLKKQKIKKYLAFRRAEARRESLLSAERTVQEIALAAYADFTEVAKYDITGPEDLPHLPEHLRRVIKGWKWDRFGHFVIDFVDKQQALDQLMRYFGLYQGDAMNEKDRNAMMMATAVWQFVMSLHAQKGLSIAEAYQVAEQNPKTVEEWGRRQGLITNEIVVE